MGDTNIHIDNTNIDWTRKFTYSLELVEEEVKGSKTRTKTSKVQGEIGLRKVRKDL